MSNKIPLRLAVKGERSCGDCTACCEGWLSAEINGHEMYPGKPCHFVEQGKGCTIYKDRPKEPCKNFACMWKVDKNIPEHFKPSISGTILAKQEIDGIPYLAAVPAGKEINPELLSWLVTFGTANKINIRWDAGNRPFFIGFPDFSQKMAQSLQPPIDNSKPIK